MGGWGNWGGGEIVFIKALLLSLFPHRVMYVLYCTVSIVLYKYVYYYYYNVEEMGTNYLKKKKRIFFIPFLRLLRMRLSEILNVWKARSRNEMEFKCTYLLLSSSPFFTRTPPPIPSTYISLDR